MKNKIAGLLLLLLAYPVLANEDVVTVQAPPVDADPTGLIVFAVLFVAMIGGFAGYIWLQERKKKSFGKDK